MKKSQYVILAVIAAAIIAVLVIVGLVFKGRGTHEAAQPTPTPVASTTPATPTNGPTSTLTSAPESAPSGGAGLPAGWVKVSTVTDSDKLVYGEVAGKGPTGDLSVDELNHSNVAMGAELFVRAYADPKANAPSLMAASDPTFYASVLAADPIPLPEGKATISRISGASATPDPLTGSPYVDVGVEVVTSTERIPAYTVRMEWFGNDHDSTGVGVWRAVALDYASEDLTNQKIPPLGVSLRNYVADRAADSVKQIISRAPQETRDSWAKRVGLYLSAPTNALASFSPPADAPQDTIQAYDRASLMFVTPADSKDIFVYVSTWYAPSQSPQSATGAEFIVQMSGQFNTFSPQDAFTIEQWNTAHPEVAIGDEQ